MWYWNGSGEEIRDAVKEARRNLNASSISRQRTRHGSGRNTAVDEYGELHLHGWRLLEVSDEISTLYLVVHIHEPS